MEGYPIAAVERAMKVHEVILRARAKKITWIAAAEILGMAPRTLRRWKWRMERFGVRGLMDRRCQQPSRRRVAVATIDRILALYRDRYHDYNIRHFHQTICEHHQVQQSYTFVKQILQGAGLVGKQRPRGKHRQRRERRACLGEMLHLDGSRHHWLALAPEEWQSLITVVDDATGRLLYAQLWPGESSVAVMTALRAVFLEHGLPQQLYTDRASWAAHTARAGGKPDPRKPTQVERALAELGVEHLRAYSPQARGRSERVNRTLQGRLVNELRVQGLRTMEDANRWLREHYLAEYDRRFSQAPAESISGFVPVTPQELEPCLCWKGERIVNRDNTVVLAKCALQIPKQPGRRSCQNLRVVVRQHLDGRFTVSTGPRLLARYDSSGRLENHDSTIKPVPDPRSTGLLGGPFFDSRQRKLRRAQLQKIRDTVKRPDHLSKPSGQSTC